MPHKRKIIVCPIESIDALAKVYGVTASLVYNALAYRTDSRTAQKIRQDALANYGGIETTKIVFP